MRYDAVSLSLSLFLSLGVTACDPALDGEELLDEDFEEDFDEDSDDFRMVGTIPTSLPVPAIGVAPEYDALMTVSIGGVNHDVRTLLAASNATVPRARITGVFRTTPTPDRLAYSAVSDTSTSATQVYRCNGASWVFQRPEAGLVPLMNLGAGPVPVPDDVIRDHYLHPGPHGFGPDIGPAWRITNPTPTLRDAAQRFVGRTSGSDFVSVPNPAAPATAVNLLRVPANTSQAVGTLQSPGLSQNLPSGRGFVFRLDTVGGRAPASCAASQNGQEMRVSYSTDYYFVQLVES